MRDLYEFFLPGFHEYHYYYDLFRQECEINNNPGVLENGLFTNLTDEVLVGKLENDSVSVESLKKI